MPDQEPVNISVLASELASTLKTISNHLYDNQYMADPMKPVSRKARILLSALEEKRNARELETEEEEKQTQDAIENLQEFYFSAKHLEQISDDIAKKPNVQDLGVFRTQWDECCLGLLKQAYPLWQVLDSVSEMAGTWPPGALPAAGQVGTGNTKAGAATRTRDKTSRRKNAG